MWSTNEPIRATGYRVWYDPDAEVYLASNLMFDKWNRYYRKPTLVDGKITLDVWAETMSDAVRLAAPLIEDYVGGME